MKQLVVHELNDRGVRIKLKENQTTLSECKVSLSNNIWNITEWFTDSKSQGQGFGKACLCYAIDQLFTHYGEPDEIRYNWNGVNEYVMDFLKRHFDPVSILPISEQKFNEQDSWEAHIYVLNKDKVFDYCNIEREQER